jgi:hypothetical protein
MLTGGACVTHFHRCTASASVKHRCLSLTSPPACAYRWSMCNSLLLLRRVYIRQAPLPIPHFLSYIHMQMEHFSLTSTAAPCLHPLSIVVYCSLPLLYTYANGARLTHFTAAPHLHVSRIVVYLSLPPSYTPVNRARHTHLHPHTTSAPVKDRREFYTSFAAGYHENLFCHFYPHRCPHSLFNYPYPLGLTSYFSFLL